MSRKRETRRVAIRAVDVDGEPGVTLHVITPGVVDDYGSVWEPSTFDASLERRPPVLCWSHDWSEPLGPYRRHRTTADGTPDVDFVFSDFEAVPMARRAHAQVSDGTIADCSVGFSNTKRRDPTDEEKERWPGVREVIFQADLDEVSLVIRGAVPGAKVLAVRSGTVDVDAAVELARRVKDGEISQEEAQIALDLLASEDPAAASGDEATDEDAPVVEPDAQGDDETGDALVVELDEALALLDRSRPR